MRKQLMVVGAVALVAAGCGDDSDSESAATTEAEASLSPEQAIAEIGEVRQGLDQTIDDYAAGDAAAAEETVSETYLQHFELVEGPLEEADEELNEELEHLIREDIRNAIADGEPKARVEALIQKANNGLDEAEQALKPAS